MARPKKAPTHQGEVSFRISKRDRALVDQIVNRACARFPKLNRLDLEMDLIAVHANGTPMRFDALLAADDFNFWHDIGGIRSHLDRNTAQLLHNFLPRFWLSPGWRKGGAFLKAVVEDRLDSALGKGRPDRAGKMLKAMERTRQKRGKGKG